MKHIKLFEDYDYKGKKIWKLPFQDENLPVYLWKIGVPYNILKTISPSTIGWNLADEKDVYVLYEPIRVQPWIFSFVRKKGFESQNIDINKEDINDYIEYKNEQEGIINVSKEEEEKNAIDKILKDAENGITPDESIKDKKLLKRLRSNYRYDDKLKNAEVIANKKKYYDENREYIINVIIDGLKNGISMQDTIKNKLTNININEILNLLTDEDKKLINKFNKEMSNSPENIKRYNRYGEPKEYSDNVIDPFEDFIDSAPYQYYSNKIRNFKEE